MTTQRLLPAVQALGRTIVYNRSDLLHHGFRGCNNHSSSVQVVQPSSINNTLHSNCEEKWCFSHSLLYKGRGSYMKVVSRTISNSVQLFCREFSDEENEHAHDILRSLPAYQSTTVDTKSVITNRNCTVSPVFKEKTWASLCTNELVNTFVHTAQESSLHNVNLDDKTYYQLCVSIAERIPYMTDDHLLMVLAALSYWPSQSYSNSTNSTLLWNMLDKSCSNRLDKWDFSKIFLFADHWYALRASKHTIFFTNLLNHLGRNILNLTPSQLVQYLFYVNLKREFGVVTKEHLEHKIKDFIKYLNIEELGIIAMAFFKSQTSIQNEELLDTIIKATLSNLETISNHSMGALLKLLNKSLNSHPVGAHSQCYIILETLYHHLYKFNNFVLLQAALFGNNLLVFHHKVMCEVGSRFGDEMSVLRLKDIERFAYTLMLYKFVPPAHPDILQLIVNELRKPERIVEINHFPRCFVSCVNYLVAMGVFPHDLISAALQPSMVQLLKSNSVDYIGREMNELNWSLRIEVLPNYFGHSLDPGESDFLTKKLIGRLPTKISRGISHQENMLLDIQQKMSALLGGNNHIMPCIILPHFTNPDLVFCTDIDGEPISLPDEFKQLPNEALKSAANFANTGLTFNAIIIGGRNSYIRDTQELRGNLEMKKRQLIILGYKVSVVSNREYRKTSMKYKLMCLEKSLAGNSSLNIEGKRELALNTLRSQYNQQTGVLLQERQGNK